MQRLIISAFPLVLGAFVGYVVGQIGSRIIASGSLLIEGIGVLVMNLMLGYHLQWTFLIPAFIFMGLGNAGINPAISNAALLGVVVLELIVGDGYQRSLVAHLGHTAAAQAIIKAGPFSGKIMVQNSIKFHTSLLL